MFVFGPFAARFVEAGADPEREGGWDGVELVRFERAGGEKGGRGGRAEEQVGDELQTEASLGGVGCRRRRPRGSAFSGLPAHCEYTFNLHLRLIEGACSARRLRFDARRAKSQIRTSRARAC